MDIMRGTDIDLQSSYSSLAADFTASLRDLRALSMLRLDGKCFCYRHIVVAVFAISNGKLRAPTLKKAK